MKIKECDWEITTNCNLNCKHCLIKKTNSELSLFQCFKVIDNLVKLGCKRITFTGGEPLVKSGFFKILEYSYKKKIENWIFTNGTKINKVNVERIKRFVSYIGFSLEGLKKQNDLVRGKGSFDSAIKAIELVRKKNIPFGLYLTLNRYNYASIRDILFFFKYLNPINIGVNELVNRGNAQRHYREIVVHFNKRLLIGNIKAVYPGKFVRHRKCMIIPKKLVIDPLANIYGCTEIKQLKANNILGNVLNGDYRFYLNFIKNIHCKKDSLCSYESYSSQNANVTFLSRKNCVLLK